MEGLEAEEFAAEQTSIDGKVACRRGPGGKGFREEVIVG